MGGTYVSQIAHYLGYDQELQGLQIPPIPVRPVGHASARSMGIVRRVDGPDGAALHFLVGQRGGPAFEPVPLVEPPPFQAQEVHIEQVQDPDPVHAEAEVDPVPIQQPDPEPQFVPRVYQAVRLPATVEERIQRVETDVSDMRVRLQRVETDVSDIKVWIRWLVDQEIRQLQSTGQVVTPPAGFDHEAGPSGTRHADDDTADMTDEGPPPDGGTAS